MKNAALLLLCLLLFNACQQEDEQPTPSTSTDNKLNISFKFDSEQERLNNWGEPSVIPNTHAAQTPAFKGLSVHFIELVPTATTPYKEGAMIYNGAEVAANNPNPYNFSTAIDFNQAIIKGEEEVFVDFPLKDLPPGTYHHLRASVSFQQYDVRFNLVNIPGINELKDQNGTVASFLGYNTTIDQVQLNKENLAVNETKLQGFWAFETDFSAPFQNYNQVFSGQAPENATTVVNPFPDAPIPRGSCVVSGSLTEPLVITGEENNDISLTLSFSINNSFEWQDLNGNGQWDIDANPSGNSEPVVNMGLRGLKVLQQ